MQSVFTEGIDTKVDAINSVLSAIGMVGINSMDDIELDIDASDASALIDRLSQSLQLNGGKGWWFNQEEYHKLVPDPKTGMTVVPNNSLAVYLTLPNKEVRHVSLRGNSLFDPKKFGHDMRFALKGEALSSMIVTYLPFEYLPPSVRLAITDEARLWMVNDKEGDMNKIKLLANKAEQSKSVLLSEALKQKRHNLLESSQSKYQVATIGRGGRWVR